MRSEPSRRGARLVGVGAALALCLARAAAAGQEKGPEASAESRAGATGKASPEPGPAQGARPGTAAAPGAAADPATPAAAGADEGHALEVYGLLIPAAELASSAGADDTVMQPDGSGSIRGGSFAGQYTDRPANQRPRMRTISAPSHVGLRGRYRLPRGFHARFQWEIGSLTFGGTLPQTMFSPGLGLMSRNSGVFLGGPAGELGFGLWDTPMAQVGNYAPDYGVLVNASMLLSSSILGGMPFANGAVAGQTNADFCVRTPLGFFEPHNADLTHCANQAMNFDRRQANSLIYQSPALAGFALRVQHEVNFRRSSDFLEPRRNPSLWSAHLAFSRAGVYAGLGYERRQDFVADAAQMATGLSLGGLGSSQAQWSAGPTGIAGSIEEGARANLRYSFGFGLTLGVLVEQLSFYARYGAAVAGDILELQKRAGRVEAVFRRGSHTLGGAYHHALRIRGKLAGGNAFNDEASSGFGVTVGYAYAITRKLHGQLYHMSIVNERNARYNVVFQGLPSPPGADLRATGVGFQYAF